jgi:SPX domain protein involved in polyphosphate accumulation
MATNAIQGSRFEQKYIVTEEVALQIRGFIRSHLELDENAVGKPNYSYAVDSVYLDSRDLKLFWATLNNDANRFKMRLRFYDGNPEAPVFFELKEQSKGKRRTKRRAAVHRDCFESLLAGQSPQESDLASGHPNDMGVLQEFCERMHELDARPLIHVAYLREAYACPDNLA